MERVQRWREPAVVVVVLVLLARLVLVLAFAASTLRAGVDAAPDAAYLASRQLADPTPYVVLAALVLACHLRPVTAHARALAAAALVVAGVCLLLVLALAGYGYTTYVAPFSQLDLADRLAAAVVPLLAVVLLGLLSARPRSATPAVASVAAAAAEEQTRPADQLEEAAPDPGREPTWAPDAASGAAWTTAGEAASGAPATGWGTPAGTGWEVPRALEGRAAEDPADQAVREAGGPETHPWGRPAP